MPTNTNMRRAKANLMKSAIHSYLKRRRYSDSEQNFKQEYVFSAHSSQQMAIMGIVDKELTPKNTFSHIANDTRQVEHQFNRLKNWIADLKADSYRYELEALLCPLFCHLYLEMLCGSHRQSASKFFERHQALFASRENSRKLLEELAAYVSNSPDVKVNTYIKSFRSAKYHLQLSLEAVTVLQRYLSEHGHLLILQTMQKWFDVEIMQSIKRDKEDDCLWQVANGYIILKRGDEKNCFMTKEEDTLKQVEDVIRTVKEKPVVNPLLLYVISNIHQDSRVSCTTIDEQVTFLGAGVNNSIKLWGLSRKMGCRAKYSSISLRTPVAPLASETEILCPEKHAITLYGHAGPVQDIAFIPRATSPGVLVSVSQDATMRSWRLDSYECAASYRGHNHEIWCLDVSSLGLFVATGSRDRTARIWSLDRNFPLRTCAGHHLDVECIKFHPNNLYFATGSADKTVKMWSVNDARLLRLFFGHTSAIQALGFSPNGKFLASADEDRIKIWDLAAGKLYKEFAGHTGSVLSLAWDKTNEYLSSCSSDGSVRLWTTQDQGDSSENPPPNLLRTYSVGSGVLSVQYSISNTWFV
ncbi:hypothetical protein R5R35_013089 [Gryllus longicercus]|uniref:TFIID subunit TAF5 NTD2 domain-containing protein n=1 Tax=Gryllus longicercus TaxID=2509291 RepID=A0AAN9Z0J9_9ORTH